VSGGRRTKGKSRRDRRAATPVFTTSPAAAPAGSRSTAAAESGAAAVAHLIARGKAKQAVTRARDLHARVGSPATEAIVVDAYCARIAAFGPEMSKEAIALLEMVRERYPSAGERLEDLRLGLLARSGRFAELLAPLAGDELDAGGRGRIESAVRQHAVDPAAIAACEALVLDHPLRIAAGAVVTAFERSTSGPTEASDVALPEVSRRSPLAPWKFLVRAFERFYAGDGAGCERALGAIPADAAVARAVPVLRALLADPETVDEAALGRRGWNLFRQVRGRDPELVAAIDALDRAFADYEDEHYGGRALRRSIRAVGRACRQSRPDLTDRLGAHLSVACYLSDVAPEMVAAAFGPVVHGAHFWRLWARAAELEGDPINAAARWDRFRCHAVAEGLIEAGSPDEAGVYLHIAELVAPIPRRDLAELREHWRARLAGLFTSMYEHQPEHVAALAPKGDDTVVLDPHELFARAVAGDPSDATFRRWLAWSSGGTAGEQKQAEEAARAWREARPEATEPILFSMKACERRGALKKALGLLAAAQRLDPLSRQVREAHIRLLVASTLRHVAAHKPHLARKDLVAIAEHPLAKQERNPAVLAALRWLVASVTDDGEAESWLEACATHLGGPLAASALARALVASGRIAKDLVRDLPAPRRLRRSPGVARQLGAACAAGDRVGLDVPLPKGWAKPLLADLKRDGEGQPQDLLALARACLLAGELPIAYAAAGTGLRHPQANPARFLLLRACSLPAGERSRRHACAVAAVQLARSQRDMELVAELIEVVRREIGSVLDADLRMDAPALSAEEVEQVVEYERHQRSYPTRRAIPEPEARCSCPVCQASRRGRSGRKARRRAAAASQPSLWDASELEIDDGDGRDQTGGRTGPRLRGRAGVRARAGHPRGSGTGGGGPHARSGPEVP